VRRLGFNHIDLATKNMAATRDFYARILGFPVVRSDIVALEAGGHAEHVFFDCGDGQMIAFASAEHAPGFFPPDFDTGINQGLGLSGKTYHFAFEAGSLEHLATLKADLERNGVAVRGIEDHEGWCRSIYFTDPNGLQLEYCCLSRALTEDDAIPQVRFRVSRQGEKLPA
jgi:catechol 2,3-dioxygenase-like lactoylglutathione lyase family enzyme